MHVKALYFSDVITTRRGFLKKSDALGDELEALLKSISDKLHPLDRIRRHDIVDAIAVTETWFEDFKVRIRESEAKAHEYWKARREELDELKRTTRQEGKADEP